MQQQQQQHHSPPYQNNQQQRHHHPHHRHQQQQPLHHHYSGQQYIPPDQKPMQVLYNSSHVSVSPTSFRFMESECIFRDIHDGYGGRESNEQRNQQLLHTSPYCSPPTVPPLGSAAVNSSALGDMHPPPPPPQQQPTTTQQQQQQQQNRLAASSSATRNPINEFRNPLKGVGGRHVVVPSSSHNDHLLISSTNDDLDNLNDDDGDNDDDNDNFVQFAGQQRPPKRSYPNFVDPHILGFNVQMNDSYLIGNQLINGAGTILEASGVDLLDDNDDVISFQSGTKMMKRKAAPTLATGRRSKDDTLPPEEHEKRQLRRERNKIAAAKCRRRRADLTRELEEKTSKLNNEKEALEMQILRLSEDKYKLESFIMAHQKSCDRFKNELRNSAILSEIAANINRRSV